MPSTPSIARIWRGRTRRDVADRYEQYLRVEGIPPLEKTALGVQLLREDLDGETWFTTISYWSDMQAMTAFTKDEPTKVHHLDRDPELLIELPERVEIHRVLIDRYACAEHDGAQLRPLRRNVLDLGTDQGGHKDRAQRAAPTAARCGAIPAGGRIWQSQCGGPAPHSPQGARGQPSFQHCSSIPAPTACYSGACSTCRQANRGWLI